jgi:PD-(D/E)XK endonuclease
LSKVTTDQKGAIAELAIALAAVRLGIDVYRPVAEGGRYDLIFELDGSLWRIQCKMGSSPHYCPDVDRCYFLPYALFESRTEVALRLTPTQNNQALGVNWASQYEFAARLGRQGAVAQLGERESGTLEVTGSSPVGSIGR